MTRRSGPDSTQQVRLHVTVGHFLNIRIGVNRRPLFHEKIELEGSVGRRPVRRFGDITDAQKRVTISDDRKSDRVAIPLSRQAATPQSVAEIAIPEFFDAWLDPELTGRRAMSIPAATQGQPGRMQPDRK